MIGAYIVYSFIMGGLGYWVASQKSRSEGEGFLLGILFGIFGVIVEGQLPTNESLKERIERLQRESTTV